MLVKESSRLASVRNTRSSSIVNHLSCRQELMLRIWRQLIRTTRSVGGKCYKTCAHSPAQGYEGHGCLLRRLPFLHPERQGRALLLWVQSQGTAGPRKLRRQEKTSFGSFPLARWHQKPQGQFLCRQS